MNSFYLSFGIIIIIFAWFNPFLLCLTNKGSILEQIWGSKTVKIIAKLSINAYLIFPMVEAFAIYTQSRQQNLRNPIETNSIELFATVGSYFMSFLLIIFCEGPANSLLNWFFTWADPGYNKNEDSKMKIWMKKVVFKKKAEWKQFW